MVAKIEYICHARYKWLRNITRHSNRPVAKWAHKWPRAYLDLQSEKAPGSFRRCRCDWLVSRWDNDSGSYRLRPGYHLAGGNRENKAGNYAAGPPSTHNK